MKFVDIEAIKKRMASDADYQAMHDEMAKEAIGFHATFEDDPKKISRWGHHYFCEEDGSALIYDPEKPHDHVCPLCGRAYHSELFDGVWVYSYRNAAILTLMKSAILYRISGEERFKAIYEEILSFYMKHYLAFKLHNKEGEEFDTIDEMHWGCGRIMPQGLNEAIILNRMLFSMELMKEAVSDDVLDAFKMTFIPEVFRLLKPQVIQIHNISCWMNAVIGSMGLFAGNQEMIDFAFKGEFNIGRQLREGVTDDNFWYEGSIHYNFFTLEGVTSLTLFAKVYDYDFGPELAVVENMLITAYYYAFDNHRFPNPNDGWPNVNLKTYSYIYSIGTKVFGYDSEVGKILNCILAKEEERGTVPLSKPYYYDNRLSYERFILLPDYFVSECAIAKGTSRKFAHSNFALLKNDRVNLFYKYGHNGKSHAHPDKMTIEATLDGVLLTKDLSNAGYGSVICNEWHRVTASHNTIVVDGQNHTSTEPGEVLDYSENRVKARAVDVYEDVAFTRDLKISEKGFEDIFTAESDQDRNYDFIFHVKGECLSELSTGSGSIDYSSNGYQHMKDIQKVVAEDNEIILDWMLDGKEFQWTFETDECDVFFAKTPDNPISDWRHTLILRKKGKKATFKQKWEIK